MSKLVVNTSIPVGAISHSVSSASKHIIKSKLQRFYPESQVNFTPEGNNEVVFHISSPSDMWDPTSSYIRFKLTSALQVGGVNDLKKYMSEGGIHSLFSKVEIFTRAGVLIERIDDYNKLYSLMSSASMSRDFVTQSKQDEGDSGKPYNDFITANLATATYTSATRTFAALAGAALSEVPIGSRIKVVYKDASGLNEEQVVEMVVESVTDNNAFVVSVDVITADLLAGEIVSIEFADKPKTVREVIANTAGVEVMMCPWSPFLNNGSYIPLQLIRGGLRIVFTLARAPFALVSRASGTFSAADFTINQPEWMCQMYQPDESLNAQMLDMYKNQGLHYMYPIYRHFLDVVTGGENTSNLNHHVNLRSVRSVYQKIQDERANIITAGTVNSGKSTYTCDSVAQGLKAGLETYQYSVGSLRFPESTPTKLSTVSNAEALKELKRTLGQMGASNVFDKRFQPCEWRSSRCSKYPNESGNRADSQRLILSAKMARDPTPFSGIDASLANLQSELKFNATYQLTDSDGATAPVSAQRYIHTWTEADAVLSLQADATVRRS